MKIKVASRAEIISKASSGFEDATMIISISCTRDKEPNALKRAMVDEKSNVVHVEFFHFDDIDKEYHSIGLNSISEEDAKRIVKTVKEWAGKADTIYVHCDAGVSRSAGVAAAISKALTGDDEYFYTCRLYAPNPLCYKKVLDAFGLTMKQEDYMKLFESESCDVIF